MANALIDMTKGSSKTFTCFFSRAVFRVYNIIIIKLLEAILRTQNMHIIINC